MTTEDQVWVYQSADYAAARTMAKSRLRSTSADASGRTGMQTEYGIAPSQKKSKTGGRIALLSSAAGRSV